MTSYSADVTQHLTEDLHDCLLDAGVTEDVAKFLVRNKILKLAAFADLADSKAGIIEVVGRPAGLDPNDMIACQPLKTAWRDAEAKTKATLEAQARGEDIHKDATLGTEQRERLDDQVKGHFHFTWPAAWLSTNSLLGRLKRFYDKRTDFVPKLDTDVRSILETESDTHFKLFVTKGGSFQAQPAKGYSPVHGLWKLRERHFQLMVAYNHAAFPDFDNASLTLLLEYHQWVMSKAVEGPYDPAAVQALLKADFHMRTKWMLSWRQKEFPTFTEVIKHHRGHSAYLFTDIARPPRVLRETKRSLQACARWEIQKLVAQSRCCERAQKGPQSFSRPPSP